MIPCSRIRYKQINEAIEEGVDCYGPRLLLFSKWQNLHTHQLNWKINRKSIIVCISKGIYADVKTEYFNEMSKFVRFKVCIFFVFSLNMTSPTVPLRCFIDKRQTLFASFWYFLFSLIPVYESCDRNSSGNV